MANEEQHSSNVRKMAGIAAFSAAAGAFAAVMLTPKSGRDLRDHIKGKAENMRDKAATQLDKMNDKVQE